MLTIKDLSADKALDSNAMRDVRGGFDFLSLWNAPVIDAGYHFLGQGQAAVIDQSYNLGGLNLVINDQEQNGVAGQVF